MLTNNRKEIKMIDINNPTTGLIGWGNSKSGVSAALQHAVVGTGTHTFVVDYPSGSNDNIPQVFESDRRVGNEPWINYLNMKEYDMRLYSVIGITKEEIAYALDYIKIKFMGKTYGYTQWLWFPYKMICEKVFKVNVNKQTNWFKNWLVSGLVCHEITWWNLSKVVECNPVKWTKLAELINQYKADTITSTDFTHLLERNPDVFKLEMSRENEIVTVY
jgi:hypothetical protein